MCILSSRCAGFIDNKRIDVLADMILSPLGFVLIFILRHTGICSTLAHKARPPASPLSRNLKQTFMSLSQKSFILRPEG